MELKINGQYTIYGISEFMACTTKNEIVIKGQDDRGYIFSARGKRKKYYLTRSEKKDKDTVICEGWDLPLKIDSDIEIDTGLFTTKSFSGNALLNFVGTVEFVKEWIETKNLNPLTDKGIIVAVGKPGNMDTEFMVYPEEALNRGHAVAQRILEKQKQVIFA